MATDYSSKETREAFASGVVASELTLRPVMMEIAGKVAGLRVLDLGCGNGSYSIAFAKQEAVVDAFDASVEQIELAQKMNAHKNLTYRASDVSHLNDVQSETVDLVFMNMLFPDLQSPMALENVISEAHRVLEKDGRLIFSALHPFYLIKETGGHDVAQNFKYEDYFNEGSTYRGEATAQNGGTVVFNETHFSITFVSKILTTHGFLIRKLVEGRVAPEKGIPLPRYLIFECVKS